MKYKRCYHCGVRINLKKEEYVRKYNNFWGYYGSKGFVYKQEWWHPWCWELEKKKPFYYERGWSDTDPAQDKLDRIQRAKEEYLLRRG